MNDAQAAFCAKCGAPQPGAPASASPSYVPPPAPGTAATGYAAGYAPPVPRALGYGGFWVRFVAIIIDGLIIRVAMIPFAILIFGRLMFLDGWFPGSRMTPDEAIPFAFAAGKLAFIQMVAFWLYEAFMTSSSKQATLGKMVFGLRVVTADAGRQLSFAHATGRHFAKYVSVFTGMIGFIVAGFTARKQALHDFIANTVVVKTTS